LVSAAVLACVLSGAGIAIADVPDGNTIHACRNKTTFAIRVIDTDKAQACASTETALSWTRLRWRGAWSVAVSYTVGDSVGAGGQSYIAVAASTNKAPATNPSVWNLMAARGAKGDPGVAPGLGTGTNLASQGATGTTCALAQIRLYAGNQFSHGEVPANGQLLPIASNTALYSLLGTTYGGDGISTFALPNLTKLAPDHMTYTICIAGIFP
jgi:hypothetical protein